MEFWIGTVIAVGTFVLGLVLGRGQLRAFKAAEEDRQVEAEERRLSEARGISVWVDLDESNDDEHVMWVGNTGDQPVYQTVVYVSTGYVDHPEPMEIVCMTVPPHQKLRCSASVKHLGPVDYFPYIPRVSVRFTDANGRHWLRDENGQLVEQEMAARAC